MYITVLLIILTGNMLSSSMSLIITRNMNPQSIIVTFNSSYVNIMSIVFFSPTYTA